jgi:predicted negative regulator of RcsB-dependent stress response
MSEATQTQTQTLEQTLNKTDLGHVLYENRKLLLGAVLAILVGITGWVIYTESKKSAALDSSVKVFEFQTKVWSEAKAGKIQPADLTKAFNELDKTSQTSPVMIPVALEMGKFLFEKGDYTAADSVLAKFEGVNVHPVGAFFIGMQRSVIQEKAGNIDGAIATLEKVAQMKDSVMPARVSVELARLYIAKGEKGKAQTQLDHVLNTYPNDEQAKIAKLYKVQLAQ